MATLIRGEYVPASTGGMQQLWDLTVPTNQLPATNLILGDNITGSSSQPNQHTFACPFNVTVTNVILTVWSTVPTAGSVSITVAGTTVGSVTAAALNLSNIVNFPTNISISNSTRQVVTATATTWTQATPGGLRVQVWGFIG